MRISILSLFFLLAYLPLNAQAASNFVFNPLAAAGARWDSNYFLESVDEKSIYSFLLKAGLELGYATEKTRLAFSGDLDAYFYEGDEGPDDFLGFSFKFLLDREEITERLFYGFENTTRRSRDTELIDQQNQTNSRDLNTLNIFRPYIDYETKRFSTRIDYENKLVRFDEDLRDDSNFNKVGAHALYKLNKTYQMGPRLEWIDMNYDGESIDYRGYKAYAVVNRFGNYLDLVAGVGYQNRTFDTPEETTYTGVPWFVTATNEQKRTLKRTRIKLDLRNDINDNSSISEGYFEGPQVVLDVQHQLNKRLSAGFNGYYAWNDYVFTDRNDDVRGLGISADYRLYRSFFINMKLGYDDRDSSDDFFDYDNIYTFVRLSYRRKQKD